MKFHPILPFSERLKRMPDKASFHPSIDDPDQSQTFEALNTKERRPLHLRHYDADAWSQFTVPGPDKPVKCVLNANPKLSSDATMCVIPTRAGPVDNPADMKQRANVRSEWLDRLVSRGCSVLFVHGKWFDNLTETAEMVEAGYDPFTRVERRINAAVDHCIESGYATSGRVLAIGSSRYAFAVLRSMGKNRNISGVVAHQPVVWWPSMREFSELKYNNPIIKRNSLYEIAGELPPRPLLIQTGYMDERIGPFAMEKLIETYRKSYQTAGESERFTHELMEIPGHSGQVPDSAIDSLPQWLTREDSTLYHGTSVSRNDAV